METAELQQHGLDLSNADIAMAQEAKDSSQMLHLTIIRDMEQLSADYALGP